MPHILSDARKSEDGKETIIWKGRKSGNTAPIKTNEIMNFTKVELKKSAMSRQTSTIPDRKSKPIKVPTFPETTFEEVYARQQAARKKREQILGKIATEEPDNEDDISVAEFQIKGKQRKRLDDRIYEWLEGVPESGFSKGQRKLNVEETKDWLEMGKKLRRVKVNDEAKSAGSWVGGKFFPDGFW